MVDEKPCIACGELFQDIGGPCHNCTVIWSKVDELGVPVGKMRRVIDACVREGMTLNDTKKLFSKAIQEKRDTWEKYPEFKPESEKRIRMCECGHTENNHAESACIECPFCGDTYAQHTVNDCERPQMCMCLEFREVKE